MTTSQPAQDPNIAERMPRLEFVNPDCPLCGTETNCEAGEYYDCQDCGMAWCIDGGFDERLNAQKFAQCAATDIVAMRIGDLAAVTRTYRCALDAAEHHGLEHHGYRIDVADGVTHSWKVWPGNPVISQAQS